MAETTTPTGVTTALKALGSDFALELLDLIEIAGRNHTIEWESFTDDEDESRIGWSMWVGFRQLLDVYLTDEPFWEVHYPEFWQSWGDILEAEREAAGN